MQEQKAAAYSLHHSKAHPAHCSHYCPQQVVVVVLVQRDEGPVLPSAGICAALNLGKIRRGCEVCMLVDDGGFPG